MEEKEPVTFSECVTIQEGNARWRIEITPGKVFVVDEHDVCVGHFEITTIKHAIETHDKLYG